MDNLERIPFISLNQTKDTLKLTKKRKIKLRKEQSSFNSIDMETRKKFLIKYANQNQTFTCVKNPSMYGRRHLRQDDKFLTTQTSAKYPQNKRIFCSPGATAKNYFFPNTLIKEEKSDQKPSSRRVRQHMNGFFSSKQKNQHIFSVELEKKSPEKRRRKFKLRKKDSFCFLTKSHQNDSNDSMAMKKREKKSIFSKFINCPRLNAQRISKIVKSQHNSRNKNVSMSSYSPIEADRMLSPIMQKEDHFSLSRNIIPLNISDHMTVTDKIRQLNMRKKIKHPEGDTKVDKLLRTMVQENEHKEEIESKKRLSKIQLMELIKKRKSSIVKKYLGID